MSNDKDLEIDEDGSSLSNLNEDERKLFFERKDFSIFELFRRYERGDIDLNPHYQRNDIWTDPKKSKLIESVLINVPIPFIYLAEVIINGNVVLEVVDGKQRLLSFFKFMKNEYFLKKLEILDDFNNYKFENLPSNYRRKLEDYQLYTFIIKKETHPDVKFDIFQRINEGAVKLNAQELRNSIYRGKKIENLEILAELDIFKKHMSPYFEKRFKTEELMLRFLSFYINGYENYKGNISSFLNNTLNELDNIDIEKFKNIVNETIKSIEDIFESNLFIKSSENIKRFNISLFDILIYSFSKIEDKNLIFRNKDNIINLYKDLIENDKDFLKSITENTLSIKNVRYRFETWVTKFNSILEEK